MIMNSDMKPLDPVLLLSFLKVCETLSFTEAARRLGLRQSSVSQHVARLERRVGRRLLERDTPEVRPTPDGDALLPFAREALEAGRRIEHYLRGSTLRGRLRLGVSEDFAYTALPEILAEFAMQHHAVDLELTVGLSGLLYEQYDAGDLDRAVVEDGVVEARALGESLHLQELVEDEAHVARIDDGGHRARATSDPSSSTGRAFWANPALA